MGARHQRAVWFVEPDVAVSAEPEHHQIDSTRAVDRFFEPCALRDGVWGHSIEEMSASRREVQVIKEMPAHEALVACGIVRGQPDELVQVERGRVRTIHAAGPIQGNELAIKRNRRLPGRQPEHDSRIVGKLSRHFAGERPRRATR